MIHEATYIDGDKILANNYHHSHIDDVFRLIHQSNVKKSFIIHLSNRYNLEDIEEINRALKEMKDTPNFEFVKDFDTFKF